jgi:hypothetical protein
VAVAQGPTRKRNTIHRFSRDFYSSKITKTEIAPLVIIKI